MFGTSAEIVSKISSGCIVRSAVHLLGVLRKPSFNDQPAVILIMMKQIGKLLIKHRTKLPRSYLTDFFKWTTLRSVLDNLNINCVIDVGANRGQFASTLRDIGYRGQIRSFEPLPGEFAFLSRRFKDDLYWRGINVALGKCEGVTNFNQVINSTELSSFNQLKPCDRSVRVIPVPVKRLDAIWEDVIEGIINPRVFLKCDTQGFDYEVISGAENVIGSILGLQSEIVVSSPYYEKTTPYHMNLAKYEQLGFSLMGTFDGAFCNKTGSVGEMDCILARTQKYRDG
jgi:FkbM family methyltransferase